MEPRELQKSPVIEAFRDKMFRNGYKRDTSGAKKLDLARFAAENGLNESYLRSIFNYRSSPTVEYLERLAVLLDCKIEVKRLKK